LGWLAVFLQPSTARIRRLIPSAEPFGRYGIFWLQQTFRRNETIMFEYKVNVGTIEFDNGVFIGALLVCVM
jgi:hypothetical protein